MPAGRLQLNRTRKVHDILPHVVLVYQTICFAPGHAAKPRRAKPREEFSGENSNFEYHPNRGVAPFRRSLVVMPAEVDTMEFEEAREAPEAYVVRGGL